MKRMQFSEEGSTTVRLHVCASVKFKVVFLESYRNHQFIQFQLYLYLSVDHITILAYY